jgi:hypothetical protein
VWSVALGLLCLSACGGGSEPSSSATRIAIADGNGQNAQVSTAVPVSPSVLVSNDAGDPVEGVRVTFTVVTGGGSVSGGVVTTDVHGIAAVGSWSLGIFAGVNTLNANVPGLPTVTFNATATAGAPAQIEAATAVSQVALAGAAVPVDPAVLVTDAFGNGIPGIVVTFSVTAGSGSITGTPVTTGSNGVATLGSWVLDAAPGPNTITAAVGLAGIAGNPVTFHATGSTTAYTIDLRFLGSIDPAQQQAFLGARARLQSLVIGDVADIPISIPAGSCIATQPALNETVDDLIIFAQVIAIDGPGKILGRAGPCVFHTNGLPTVGIMEFDVADLAALQSSGMLQQVITHEMLHVLGFGSIWSSRHLITGAGGADPIFTGPLARAAFLSQGGDTYPGNPVPLENTGGPGTRDSHWRESIFNNELMTGFINQGTNPISLTTVESLQDLGYVVDPGGADPFSLAPMPGAPAISTTGRINLGDDTWHGPTFQLDRSGRARPVRQP